MGSGLGVGQADRCPQGSDRGGDVGSRGQGHRVGLADGY